ncbi:unnamed protein product [Rotaria magnacalcarata]
MSDAPKTKQPEPVILNFRLMPDEYIRFEYNYKPGCCCFTSKTTTVTNLRLLTDVIKTPTIFSKQTSTGKQTQKIMYLANINDIKQLASPIPSSQNKWWMKCIDILTCSCSSSEVEWLDLCHGVDNVAFDTTEFTMETNNMQKQSLVERF